MKKIISVLLAAVMLTVSVLAVSGDVNGDNELNNKDVVSLFRYVSGDKSAVKNEDECDMNGDGGVDNKDVVSLFRAVSSKVDPTGMFEELFFYPNNDEEHEFDFSGDLAEDFRGLNIHVDRRIWGIYPGERFQLRFSSYYTYDLRISIKDVDVEITSGNEFATLDERGVFTAIKPGEVEITATLKAYPALTRKAIVKIVEPQEKNDMWQGSGTFRDPYLVSTTQDFLNIQKISNYPNYDEVQICWFKQTNDIDFTGVDFEPGFFTHNYDGNGYKLKNITVNGDTVERDASVFGYAVCCVIKNVTIENFRYERHNMINAWNAAVFFGCTSSVTAYNCHAVNAYIDITDNEGNTGTAGGFLAHEVYDGSYINCSTDATVKGDMNIGGFYGTTESKHGIFVNCKASGTATAKQESLYGFDLFGGFTSQQTPGGKDNNNYIKTTEFYNCQWSQYDKMLEINNVITTEAVDTEAEQP